MHIGKALRRIRELKGLPMKYIAYKTGVGCEAIGFMERNSKVPRAQSIAKIAKALEVSVTAVVLHGLDEKEIPAEHLENFRNLKRDIL